jgi:hypothetical protein
MFRLHGREDGGQLKDGEKYASCFVYMEDMLEDCFSNLEEGEWQDIAPSNPPIWKTGKGWTCCYIEDGERLDLLLPGERGKTGPAVTLRTEKGWTCCYQEDGERLDLLLPGGRGKAGPAVTWRTGKGWT